MADQRPVLPETVCDGGVLLHVHRQIQEVLIFTAHLQCMERSLFMTHFVCLHIAFMQS